MKTRRIVCSMVFVAAVVLLCSAPNATAQTIQPTIDGTIQDGSMDGNPDIVLDNSIVEALHVTTLEDRGIIEFSLSGLSHPVATAELVLPVFSSLGPFPFTIDVYGYTGDGALTITDWFQGSLITSFSYSGEQTVTLDVTSFINSRLAAGDAFVGFNLRRADVSNITLNGPTVAFGSLEFPPPVTLRITQSSSPVSIDIKPGGGDNSINPRSKGKIPVAILSTETFDATTVDPSTVRFGATGTEAVPVHFAFADVDGDGDVDLILHFNTQDTGIVCGATSASLTGETVGGQVIAGADSINTVGCK